MNSKVVEVSPNTDKVMEYCNEITKAAKHLKALLDNESNLPLHFVSGCLFTKEDLQRAWMHGELRVPKEHRHLNSFDEYFKHEYKTKDENYGGLQIP